MTDMTPGGEANSFTGFPHHPTQVESLEATLQTERDRAERAETAAKLNAETIAAMQRAHCEDRALLWSKINFLSEQLAELRSTTSTLRRETPPHRIAAMIHEFVAENQHEIVVSDALTLGSLADEERWRAYGLAYDSIVRDIVAGTPLHRLCRACRDEACAGCGASRNDREGAFLLPINLREALATWRLGR